MKEFLKSIGITKSGTTTEDGTYVIDLDDYDEYGKMFSILEKAQQNEQIEQVEDKSLINLHNTDVSYVGLGDNDNLEISLFGDLDNNSYKIVVSKF